MLLRVSTDQKITKPHLSVQHNHSTSALSLLSTTWTIYWVNRGSLEIVPSCEMSCQAYLFLLMSLFLLDLIPRPLRLNAFFLNPVPELTQLYWSKYWYLLKFRKSSAFIASLVPIQTDMPTYSAIRLNTKLIEFMI